MYAKTNANQVTVLMIFNKCMFKSDFWLDCLN